MSPEPDTAHGDATSRTRRGFLGLMTCVLGGIPIVGGLIASLRAGLAPDVEERPARIPLCRLDELPKSGIKQFSVSFQQRQGPIVESVAKVVFVTRNPANGELLALSGECTHLSCPVQHRELKYDGDKTAPLTCPCHGGKFSVTGEVLDGPPRRPLRHLTLDKLPEQATDTVYLLEV